LFVSHEAMLAQRVGDPVTAHRPGAMASPPSGRVACHDVAAGMTALSTQLPLERS
jgi:hypothetical protein